MGHFPGEQPIGRPITVFHLVSTDAPEPVDTTAIVRERGTVPQPAGSLEPLRVRLVAVLQLHPSKHSRRLELLFVQMQQLKTRLITHH